MQKTPNIVAHPVGRIVCQQTNNGTAGLLPTGQILEESGQPSVARPQVIQDPGPVEGGEGVPPPGRQETESIVAPLDGEERDAAVAEIRALLKGAILRSAEDAEGTLRIRLGADELRAFERLEGLVAKEDYLRVAREIIGAAEPVADLGSIEELPATATRIRIGHTFMPRMFIKGKMRETEMVDKVGFAGREAGEAWTRGNWKYMVLLEYKGCKLIVYSGLKSWGFKHTFDSCTDVEGKPSKGKFSLTLSLHQKDFWVFPTVITVPPLVPELYGLLQNYRGFVGPAADLDINRELKIATPPEIRPFTKFKEGGFNPWGNGQTAVVYLDKTYIEGTPVTLWNMYCPPTPSISGDPVISWWSELLTKKPGDELFQLFLDIPSGSFFGLTYPGAIPASPYDNITAPILYLSSTMHNVPFPRIEGLAESTLFWHAPRYPIRASGIVTGHTPGKARMTIEALPLPVDSTSEMNVKNKEFVPKVREGFNPYGNGQGIYLIGAEALTALGVKPDYQGGAYMKCSYETFGYLQQLKDCSTLGGSESVGSCLVAFVHGHRPREKKEAKDDKGGKKGGYRRDGLTQKPFSARMTRLLELYTSEIELAGAFFHGSISWSTFKEVAGYYDKPKMDEAFLRACVESDAKGLAVLASRKELKVRELWVKEDKLMEYAKNPVYCDVYGMEGDEEEGFEEDGPGEEGFDEPRTEEAAEDEWKKTEPKSKVNAQDKSSADQAGGAAPDSKEKTAGTTGEKKAPDPPPKKEDPAPLAIKAIITGETKLLRSQVLSKYLPANDDFEMAVIQFLEEEDLTTEEWKKLDLLSPDDFFKAGGARRYRDLLRPNLIKWWACFSGLELFNRFSARIENDLPTLKLIWNSEYAEVEKVRAVFEIYCRSWFVLSGQWDQAVRAHGWPEVPVNDLPWLEGLLELDPVTKACLTTTVPKLGVNFTCIGDIEMAETLTASAPKGDREAIEARIRRMKNEFAGSHHSTSTNCQLAAMDDHPNQQEQPTTAAKDGTEYEPYPRLADRYEPYPRLEPQIPPALKEKYEPYPKQAPRPAPDEYHWSSTAARLLYGPNNYIGKGWTAGGKWNGYAYDYSVPPTSEADNIARTHDSILENIPEPEATAMTKAIHGEHFIITLLEWNNAISKIFSMLIFFLLFLEGGFNPYGNGQTDQENFESKDPKVADKTPSNALDVVKLISSVIAGNWQMVNDVGSISDCTLRGTISIDAVTYDAVLPFLTYNLEQVDYNNIYTVNAFAWGYALLAHNSFRNTVILRQRRPTSVDPVEYMVNPLYAPSMMTSYSAPQTLREWAALIGQNGHFPNQILASNIVGALPQQGSGFVLPFTKMFMNWLAAHPWDSSNPIPVTTQEAFDVINPGAVIINPVINNLYAAKYPYGAPGPVFPQIFTAVPDDINRVIRSNDPFGPQIFQDWNYTSWGEVLEDMSIAVVPVGEWNRHWTPTANLMWTLMFMEYPWSMEYRSLNGIANARWAHTADLVNFKGPTQRILYVSIAQSIQFNIRMWQAAPAPAFISVPITAAENMFNGQPITCDPNHDLYYAWSQVATVDRRGAVLTILKALPSIVTDSEVVAGLVNAITYSTRLAPDIVNDIFAHTYNMTRIGANPNFDNASSPLPGMLLNGLIPRATSCINPALVSQVAQDGPDQGAVSAPTPAEMIGRTLQFVVPKGGTYVLTRNPLSSLAPLHYCTRLAYRNLLLVMDKYLKSIQIPRMLAYGPWSGFNVVSGTRDHVKVEHLLASVMCPVCSPTLIVATNPPHTANHILYVTAKETHWFPIGLYTGIDQFIVSSTRWDGVQLKLEKGEWTSTVSGDVYHTGNKETLLDQLCVVFSNMNNAPVTSLYLLAHSDRGRVVGNPKTFYRRYCHLKLSYGMPNGQPAYVLQMTAQNPQIQATQWKGYCLAVMDLAYGINRLSDWNIAMSQANYNNFYLAAISKTFSTSLVGEIPLVDAGSGIDYDDSAIKRLRALKVGDPTIYVSKQKNIADKAPTDGSVNAPPNIGAMNDFVALGGAADSGL